MDLILTIAGAIGVLAGAVSGLALGGRWMIRTLRKVDRFLEDWNGEPARDGVPGRPGVMARLAHIEAELRPNGGASMRDEIRRIHHVTGADHPGP